MFLHLLADGGDKSELFGMISMAKPSEKSRARYLFRAVFLPEDPDQPDVVGPDEYGKGFGYTHAIHKSKWRYSPYCIPNEFVAARIGHFMGLPIPPFGIASDENGNEFFTSLDFDFEQHEGKRIQLPGIVPDVCWKFLPPLSTGVTLFDILIANPDRHDRNLVADNVKKPSRLIVFDHDQALLGGGNPQLRGVQRLRKLTNSLGITAGQISGGVPHCLISEIDTHKHFDHWFNRIDAIPNWVFPEVCTEARKHGLSKSESSELSQFLITRRNSFRALIENHKTSFVAIKEWTDTGLKLK